MAALRLVARLGGLNDNAPVYGWLSYAATTAVDESFVATVESALAQSAYLAGSTLSLADVQVSVVLYAAAKKELWTADVDKTPACSKWYETIINSEWFTTSAAALDASEPLAGACVSEGVLMNGSPPAVESQKYKRNRIRIKEVLKNDGKDFVGQSITVAGWAKTVRKASSKLVFVALNDGSCRASLQCVLDDNTMQDFENVAKGHGGTGASFQFVGTIVESPGESQAVDMNVTEGKLLGAVYGGNIEGTEVGGERYPMSKKEHTLEHMREHAHLRPRGNVHAAAMRIRHAMAYATHHFFNSHGFLYVHTPIITGADCEGAGEQFGITTMLGSDHLDTGIELPKVPPAEEKKLSKSEMKRLAKKKVKVDPLKPVEEVVEGAVDYNQDFFGQRVNLTVSGQLNVETHACALSDVYTFGPTFRAEESRTYRHLAEFWMIEPEIAFADLTDDINLAEDYLKYCVKYALENCADDLEFFENSPYGEAGLRDRLRNVLDNEFKVSYFSVSFAS